MKSRPCPPGSPTRFASYSRRETNAFRYHKTAFEGIESTQFANSFLTALFALGSLLKKTKTKKPIALYGTQTFQQSNFLPVFFPPWNASAPEHQSEAMPGPQNGAVLKKWLLSPFGRLYTTNTAFTVTKKSLFLLSRPVYTRDSVALFLIASFVARKLQFQITSVNKRDSSNIFGT